MYNKKLMSIYVSITVFLCKVFLDFSLYHALFLLLRLVASVALCWYGHDSFYTLIITLKCMHLSWVVGLICFACRFLIR